VRRRTAAFVGAAVVLALLGVAVAAYASADVVAEGHLLPWGGDEIRKVRVFGSVELYVSSETGKPSVDLMNSYLLLATGAVCLTAALLLRRPPFRGLFVVAGLGTAYLALDEQFAAHESIGHNLDFLADLPGIDHPDDVVLGFYAIPAGLFVLAFRSLLRGSTHASALLVAALVLVALSSLWDLADLLGKELLELVPSAALLAAFALLAHDAAREERLAG